MKKYDNFFCWYSYHEINFKCTAGLCDSCKKYGDCSECIKAPYDCKDCVHSKGVENNENSDN